MDTTPAPSELPAAPPPFGFPEDAVVEQVAMLDELARIAMTVARIMGRQIETAGRTEPAELKALAEIVVAARRTIALRNKIVADGRMTEAELAAARTIRAAVLARQEAARAAVHLRERKTQVRETVEELIQADAAERGTPPAKAEQLVQDARERLLDADIERAFGVEDNSAIILGICKMLGITPRREIWSHRMMQTQISATAQKLRDFQDGLQEPGGPSAGGLPPTPAGLGNGPGPGGSYPKVGPFTFDATGAIVKRRSAG